LLALAPLTDSLGTQVDFPTSVPVSQAVSKPPKISVPVSVNLKTVGRVETAAFKTRGGEAKADTSSDTGQVAVHTYVPKQPAKTETKVKTEADIKPTKPKKARPPSIGDTGEANSDQGFAGGDQGSTGLGEQSGVPAG
jgi:hypothetical protein